MSLIIFIVVVNFFTYIAALKCYQGSFNTTFPIPGTATECTTISKAVTCIAQYNSETSFATFSCDNKNCTINGVNSPAPMCANISRDQTNCCCYTNGCNGEMLNKAMGKEIILPTTIPVTKPKPPPPNPTKPTNSGVKLSSSSTNSAAAKELQLGGFFFLSHAECQKLCNQSVLKCVAYLYEQKNRGKCTLFQNFVDEKVTTKNLNSTAVVSKKIK